MEQACICVMGDRTSQDGQMTKSASDKPKTRHHRRHLTKERGKGDHVPTTKMGPPSLANAMSLIASWETRCIPRPQPVDPILNWNHKIGNWMFIILKGLNSQHSHKEQQSQYMEQEATLIGHLNPGEGNMWKLICSTMSPMAQLYWKYAYAFSLENSYAPTEYYSWDRYLGELSTTESG